jgi:hypothetical protein
MLHSLIAAFEKALAGFVAVNNRAGPATKTGIPASRGAGINLNRAFTTTGLRI